MLYVCTYVTETVFVTISSVPRIIFDLAMLSLFSRHYPHCVSGGRAYVIGQTAFFAFTKIFTKWCCVEKKLTLIFAFNKRFYICIRKDSVG